MTSQRIAIVGGHGKVALQLIPQLLAAGHQPVALARKEEQLEHLRSLGAEARHLDIEQQDAQEFAVAFAGCDAVVFTAGGGPDGNIDRKRTVDLEGSLKSIDGAKRAGIRRMVQVSAIGVDREPPADRGDVWAAYVKAKSDADTALRDSDLAWTILRPGGLSDDEGTGAITLAPEVERGSIPRADVAATIVACLRRDDTIGQQWELVTGSTPIDAAVDAAVTAGT